MEIEEIAEKFGKVKTKLFEISKELYEDIYLKLDNKYQSLKNRYRK